MAPSHRLPDGNTSAHREPILGWTKNSRNIFLGILPNSDSRPFEPWFCSAEFQRLSDEWHYWRFIEEKIMSKAYEELGASTQKRIPTRVLPQETNSRVIS